VCDLARRYLSNALSFFHTTIVGPSGSGKSTVTALLERFYDPTSGSITLDGTDLRLLNVKWLRDQIGLVMQEPKLFGKTIRENIAMGAPGITQDEIEQAARSAQAHDFVMSFPKGYDTQGARASCPRLFAFLSVYCLNRCCFVPSSWRLGRHAFRYVKWYRRVISISPCSDCELPICLHRRSASAYRYSPCVGSEARFAHPR
jgi:ABC transporter